MKPTIELLDGRLALGEGRQYGLGFGFAKQISPNHFKGVTPISSCKDYLNNVVYTEVTGTKITAYGLTYSKTNCFDEHYGYLFMSILPYRMGGNYTGMETHEKLLAQNYSKMELLMRHIDYKFKIPTEQQTVISVTNDTKVYLVKVPVFYLSSTYMISLYALILRMSLTFDQKKSPKEFLDTFPSSDSDYSMWTRAKVKLEDLIKKGVPNQELKTITNPGAANVHNVGIMKL